MSLTLKVPQIGESIQEATIGIWKKAEGEWVQADEPLVEIESEKATLELPAPAAGVLKKILRNQGDTVKIGEAVAEIDDAAKPAGAGKGAAAASGAEGARGKAAPATAKGAAAGASQSGAGARTASEAAVPAAAAAASVSAASGGAAGRASTIPLRAPPSARKLMTEAGLSAEDVRPSAPGGRISADDVRRTLDERKPSNGSAAHGAPAPAPAISARAADGTRERVVPMTTLRKTIARRLVEAQHTAAILTTFNEVDMSAVLALRERHQESFTKRYGFKLGFMSFFVKAAVEALKAFPAVNAEIRGQDVVYKDFYDIGVAVGGGKGLVVPVVRDADRLSFAEVEKTITDLAGRARENKLQLKELEGGTFTISNGGVYGSMLSTPILNPPQSGILGLHAIQKRAVVVGDQIAIRPMMYVALSYDHRLVDGREAVQFLVRIKECVETPERILLEV